ncbi:MAG: EAL domain-containing protein [Lachnospiraceae bacterium]|nr:EAL domain-containing protein [Lachnospiraceae bacterium]
MGKKANGMKQQNIPLSVIAIAIVLVVITIAVNILIVRAASYNMTRNYLLSQLGTIVMDVRTDVAKMKDKTQQVFINAPESRDKKIIGEYLALLKQSSFVYDFYYLDASGTLLDEDGCRIKDSHAFSEVPGIRSNLYEDDYYSYCTFLEAHDENVQQEGEDPKAAKQACFVGVKRVRSAEDAIVGYYIVTSQINNLLGEEYYGNIDSVGSGCLVDSNGELYDCSPRFLEKYGERDNVYDAVYSLSDRKKATNDKLVKMRRFLDVNKEYAVSVKGSDGKQVQLKGVEVKNCNNLFMIVILDNGLIDKQMMPIIITCFIASVLICAIMFFIIMLQMMVNYKNMMQIEQLAYTDEVTGGANLNYFKIKAPDLIHNNSENHYVIVRLDIANFRYINEAYGHTAADDVLRFVQDKFAEVFSKKEMIARINSDQFLCLVLNDSEMVERVRICEKKISDAAKEVGVKYPIRIKKGIYKIQKEDRNLDIMIDHANAARKSLKGDESRLEAVYSDEIINEMKKNDRIESEMQSALVKGEFKAYLQPKWDIFQDKIVGAEILSRWIKDDGSCVYPSDYIPIFEQNGFIEKLDFYMLEVLCSKIKEYRQKGGYNIVPVSINQSRILLCNPEYLKNVERVMTRYDTSIDDIQIEITESVFLTDREKMISLVDELKEMGLQLCMDDFGSGYSSLNILKDIPFDVLKIDKDFFSESNTSKDTKIIMRHIVEMAHNLGISVVCEGVETREQIEVLKEIGCNKVQGFYYSKPIPFEEFMEKYLRTDVSKNGNSEKEEKTEKSES